MFRGNINTTRMHLTWWRECICRGSYVVVWLLNAEQRAKYKGRKKRKFKSKVESFTFG